MGLYKRLHTAIILNLRRGGGPGATPEVEIDWDDADNLMWDTGEYIAWD